MTTIGVIGVDLGPIPTRTEVDFKIPMEVVKSKRQGDSINRNEIDIKYKCMDCGFTTLLLERIEDHQENQKKHHTWRQRFRRWWTMGRLPK